MIYSSSVVSPAFRQVLFAGACSFDQTVFKSNVYHNADPCSKKQHVKMILVHQVLKQIDNAAALKVYLLIETNPLNIMHVF